ncbi:MAG: gliding motility-associated C-terminal domain-containing protein [Bacteroidota bacterium]
MASGDFSFPSPCMGPTGLADGSTDTFEESGCNQPYPQDNFLAPIDMESGKSYALMVNNFTSTGNGFEITFGGTGTFLGPEADMEVSDPSATLCYGESITFNDNSTFALGILEGWEWNFGVDAVPATATGIGPHEVTWTSPGTKTVVLTVASQLGCIVVDVEVITVDPCCETVNAMTITPTFQEVSCPDSQDGAIDLSVTSNAPPHTFLWENNATTSGISDLAVGDYLVTITNDATCDTIMTYTVEGPPPFNITPNITMPTCDAGQDGAIELISFGGTPPYQYQWQNSGIWTTDNTLTNIPVGIYNVILEDANGCQFSSDIEVNELELELQVGGSTSPSCFGFSNGAIEINITNGLPPYQYDFNDGNGFQSSNTLENIPAGTYTVNVLDANLCEGNFEIVVSEPPVVTVDMSGVDVSCFGAGDGTVTADPAGGVGNYSFVWSNNQTTATTSNLVPGTYTVTVTDGNDCEAIGTFSIFQPDELFIDVTDIANLICFGEETGSISVIGSGGNPPYQYSLDGVVFQDAEDFMNLPAGDYTITVIDLLGCTDEVAATISQPVELTVDAGDDQTIELGFSANINSAYFPVGTVTYQWFPTDGLSCDNCPNPVASPVNNTTYTVIITDEVGCTATDEITIEVVKNRPIYIPNAFSPNFDGFNDAFTVYGGPAAAKIQAIRIFNRWGALVFEAEDVPLNEPSVGWDGTFKGKEMGPDVFAFYTYVEFIDGEVILFEGDLTLVK